MEISRLYGSLNVSASGLTAQRRRMNAIAENLANAETTRTKEGGPYRRQEAVMNYDPQFSLELDAAESVNGDLSRSDPGHLPGKTTTAEASEMGGVTANIMQDQSPYRKVFDPNHPDADSDGMVSMPNVDIVQEMTDLISASRAFEANATAFNATKQMMKKALEL